MYFRPHNFYKKGHAIVKDMGMPQPHQITGHVYQVSSMAISASPRSAMFLVIVKKKGFTSSTAS